MCLLHQINFLKMNSLQYKLYFRMFINRISHGFDRTQDMVASIRKMSTLHIHITLYNPMLVCCGQRGVLHLLLGIISPKLLILAVYCVLWIDQSDV